MNHLCLVLLTFCAVWCSIYAGILWKTCEGIADHPTIKDGNYYNLCIRKHVFTGESHAWTFTLSKIEDTLFDECVFQNSDSTTNNFTLASWTKVHFKKCRFGSFSGEAMIFDRTVMNDVHFDSCVFHNSVNLNFSKFAFNNVTFTNCQFQADSVFELGEMNDVTFDNCAFKRSESATTPSGTDSLRFKQVTARDLIIKDSEAISPVRFEGVAGADIAVNDTTMNQFHCHSEKKDGKIEYYSGFNDTAFQAVTFKDNVFCDQTTWRGFFMGNVTFNRNAYFQDSDVLDLYFDEVEMVSETNENIRFDFSKSSIKRRVLANTTIKGQADFSETVFETVYVRNLFADKADFEDASFVEQEYIDGQCCSQVCKRLKCHCNVSEPSGTCPVARRPVNLTVSAACFPADATVSRYDGLVVRMEDLAIAEKIAIGSGEHSDVFFFGHRKSDHMSEFASITHIGSKTPIRISPNHYLYVDGKLRTARSVRPGQKLRGADGEDTLLVVKVAREELRGLYAPTSIHGDLLVDGVVVSSYTDVMHPGVAHKLLHPLRLLYRYGFDSLVSRFTFLHDESLAHVPRALGIARGPEAVEG